MIDVKSLRIGNWIKTASESTPYIQIKCGEEIDYASIYNDPILLSAEILSKINGFYREPKEEEFDYEYWYPNKDAMWSIRQEGNGMWQLCIKVRENEIWKFDPILEHLHQLQNLFYSLTNTDLGFIP